MGTPSSHTWFTSWAARERKGSCRVEGRFLQHVVLQSSLPRFLSSSAQSSWLAPVPLGWLRSLLQGNQVDVHCFACQAQAGVLATRLLAHLPLLPARLNARDYVRTRT